VVPLWRTPVSQGAPTTPPAMFPPPAAPAAATRRGRLPLPAASRAAAVAEEGSDSRRPAAAIWVERCSDAGGLSPGGGRSHCCRRVSTDTQEARKMRSEGGGSGQPLRWPLRVIGL